MRRKSKDTHSRCEGNEYKEHKAEGPDICSAPAVSVMRDNEVKHQNKWILHKKIYAYGNSLLFGNACL